MPRISISAMGLIATVSVANSTARPLNERRGETILTQNGTKYRLLGSMSDFKYVVSDCSIIDTFTISPGNGGGALDAAHSNERIELITLDPIIRKSKEVIMVSKDYNISYSMFIPAGQKITSSFTIVGQVHAVEDRDDIAAMPPIMAFVLKQEESGKYVWQMHIRSDSKKISRAFPKAKMIWEKTIEGGKWYKIQLTLRTSHRGKAYVRLYVNDVKELEKTNAAIGYNNDNPSAYWQFGIYRRSSSIPFSVSYANMIQGPEISNPSAICS